MVNVCKEEQRGHLSELKYHGVGCNWLKMGRNKSNLRGGVGSFRCICR